MQDQLQQELEKKNKVLKANIGSVASTNKDNTPSHNNQLQMQMQLQGRKTENPTSTFGGQQGNDFVQQTPPMRNSMRSFNQVQMKTYE